ncbi:MAG: hypothetical protein NZ556_01190 [Fimbriimonadales bacterium]|nr:hypothetical protein [Fimbriimonadales bacterium]
METLTREEELIILRLIQELKQHPRLRRPLIEALEMVGLLDAPHQLDELKSIVERILQKQQEHSERLARIEQRQEEHTALLQEHSERLARVEQLAEEAKQEAREAKQEAREAKGIALEVRERVDRIERDLAILKGNSEEMHAAKRMPAVLGRYLRKLRIYDTQQFGLLVEEQFPSLSVEEQTELLYADWFVQGRVRGQEREVWLVVEVSWGVGVDDVERAHARAAILRQAGVEAYGAAMGRGAAPEAVARAQQLGVLLALDGALQNAETLRLT